MESIVKLLDSRRLWLAGAFGLLAGGVSIEPKLAVLAVGCAIVAFAMKWADFALGLLILALYLNLSEIFPALPASLSVVDILVLVASAAMVLRLWNEKKRPTIGAPVLWALIAYMASIAVTIFVADDPSLPIEKLTYTTKSIVFVVIVVLTADTPARTAKLLWGFLAAALVLGITGTIQFLSGPVDMNFGGLAEYATYAEFVSGDPHESTDPLRLNGPIDDPNAYAQILITLVPLAWGAMLIRGPIVYRILAAAAVGLVLITLLATHSRSALVTLALLSIAMLFVWHRRRIVSAIMVFVFFVSVGAALAPPSYYARLAELVEFATNSSSDVATGDVALRGRSAEMHIAAMMALDHPVLGVGVGHYVRNFQAYSNRLGFLPRQQDRQAHSLYLEIAAERGIVGSVAFATLLLVAFRPALTARRQLLSQGRIDDARVIEAFAIALGAYLVFALVLHQAYEHYFWVTLAGLLAASRAGMTKSPENSNETNSRY